MSYFVKRPLLKEERFIRKRDFYKEKKVLLGKEMRFLLRKNMIRKGEFYEEKNILF